MELKVAMGELMVAESPCLLKTVGIGSCVAVTLYDKDAAIGGLAHIMLPCIKEANDKSNPSRFSDVAINTMIDTMKKQGACIQDIKAKLFGGANMFPGIITSGSTMDIGNRNILTVRQELEKYNIKIIAEEVGGSIGRSAVFDTKDGSVLINSAHHEKKVY